MHITSQAEAVVRDAVRRSSVARPVVNLVEAGPALAVPPGAARAMLRGDRKEYVQRMRVELKAHAHEPRRLLAAIFPRWQYPWPFSMRVKDLFFVRPPDIFSAMREAVLDVEEGELVLRDAAGNVLLPKSSGYREP